MCVVSLYFIVCLVPRGVVVYGDITSANVSSFCNINCASELWLIPGFVNGIVTEPQHFGKNTNVSYTRSRIFREMYACTGYASYGVARFVCMASAASTCTYVTLSA